MSSTNLRNLLLKVSAGLGLCFSTLVAFPDTTLADTCDDNPASLLTSCTVTPERYSITVYEMALCTSDPLSGTDFDGSSCIATLSSTEGITVDIAGTTAGLDGGEAVRPPSAAYTYAYIKMSNAFGLRGSYELNNITYYSTDTGGASETGSATDFTSDLYDFDGGATCTATPTYSLSKALSGGTMKARITDSTYTTSTTCGTTASTRVVGTFQPTDDATLTIDETIKGLEVQFVTSGISLTVIPDQLRGTTVDSFDGGPFEPQFERIRY